MSVFLCIVAHVNNVQAIDISVGAPEVIYTKSQRASAGGSLWPDGSFGVAAKGNGTYDFYAPNAPRPVVTTGTLTNPGGAKRSVTIRNLPKNAFDYVAGGPIYTDPYSGARLMVYHAEVRKGGIKNFYSMLGLAISTDPAGRVFRDLGTIIRPNLPAGLAEVGGGSIAVIDGYFNVYFKDWLANGMTSEVAVARAPVADLLNNALGGRGTAFNKYYNGAWTEPGLGGQSSYLEVANPANSWQAVSYNDFLNQLVMVSSQWSGDGGDLYLTTSSDGIHWAPRQPLAVDAGEQFYPTVIGTGSDPTRSGQSFYVYYTDSNKGIWGRWTDAQLRRRLVTINAPTTEKYNSSQGIGYTADWVTVGDYQSDFQAGTPADGWTYAWTAAGQLGVSSTYVPLHWSETAQAYNTTGLATVAPSRTAHHDDFLALTAEGGHPGNPKYLPIAGYTIQAEDGAGLYRLADSSIQKANGAQAALEDGLRVLVYVNNTLTGAGLDVATNGTPARFDRTLGMLNVGDTIWVMIDPLRNQVEDAFIGFDFALQKLVYSTPSLAARTELLQVAAVPEPGAAGLWLAATVVGISRRRRAC